MSLEADAIVDRRRLKRSRALWRFLAVLALGAVVVTSMISFGVSGFGFGHVARLEIAGEIFDDRGLVQAIDQVAGDSSAEALLVAIDSPGGTVTGSEAIYEALRRVAAQKPVVAVMGSLAASGGYIVAIGADQIFAQRNTITGSIGVIMQATDVSGLLDKVGVKINEIKSAPLKAEPSPFHPLTPEAKKATQDMIDDAYDWFVGLVAERRKLSPQTARALGDGRVYSGRQAVENKLIDALGDDQVARAWLDTQFGVSQSLPEHLVRPVRDLTDFGGTEGRLGRAVFTALTGKSLDSKRLTLDGLVAIWHPSL